MKCKLQLFILLFFIAVHTSNAQPIINRESTPESFGNTLNLGVGPGYFSYIGVPAPFFFANYEIDVLRNFTLAPFIGFTTYRSDAYYYHGNDYYYRETVVPIGVKGTYYFNELLGTPRKWDFYAAASAGIAISNVTWDNGYDGDKGVARQASPLYLDLHIGSEYHLTHKVGLFLDLSTGVSTFGVAFHRF